MNVVNYSLQLPSEDDRSSTVPTLLGQDNHSFGGHFLYDGKVKAACCKFFQHPFLQLKTPASFLPLFLWSCLWSVSYFPMWKSVPHALGPSCLPWNLTPSGTHAWFLPALLSWDLLKSPQCLLSPYLMDLHLFPSLLNISKRAAYILQLFSSSPTCLLDLGQTSGYPWPTVF